MYFDLHLTKVTKTDREEEGKREGEKENMSECLMLLLMDPARPFITP